MKNIYFLLFTLFGSLTYAQNDTLIVNVHTTPAIDGVCNGTASVEIESGVGPFTYSWGSGIIAQGTTATNLCAGTYFVSVADGLGNMGSFYFNVADSTTTVSSNDSIIVNVVTTAATSPNNGIATAYASGGVPPYTFSWDGSPFLSNSTVNNFAAGIHTLLVQDATGLLSPTYQFTILDSITGGPVTDTTLQFEIMVLDDIDGDCSGGASVNIYSGIPPFYFVWDGGQIEGGSAVTGLCAGIHSVTVTGGDGASLTQQFIIADSSSIYGNNNYQDSVPEGYLDGGVVENCEIDYANIDSAAITSIIPVNDTVFIVTWSVYSGGNTTLLYDTLTYSGDYGVYELTLSIYCPEKSTGTFAKLKDRILVNEFLTVDENTLSSVMVYPNPFESQVTISAEAGNYSVTMYDQTGRIVGEQTYNNASDMTFNAPAELNSGVYLLNISNGKASVVKRIVK